MITRYEGTYYYAAPRKSLWGRLKWGVYAVWPGGLVATVKNGPYACMMVDALEKYHPEGWRADEAKVKE